MIVRSLSKEENEKYRNAINKGYFDDYERDPRAWKHTFAGAFVWRNPLRVSVIEVFREMLGHIPTWEDITDMNLEDFAEALSNRLTANTLHNRFSEIKAIINRHIFEVNVPSKRFQQILSCSAEPSQSIYLTEEEVRRIQNYVPQTDAEEIVRRVFLIEAYTGARNCDSARLTRNNCDMESNTLTYISQKTKTQVTLPVHSCLMPLLCAPRKKKSISLLTFNITLREICRKCGINEMKTLYRRGGEYTAEKWEFVCSHTGRRSFATNLYLRGADPVTIARLMGHSSPEITIKRYILAYREMSPHALGFFA